MMLFSNVALPISVSFLLIISRFTAVVSNP